MAIFGIRLFGDPVLRKRAAEVGAVDDSVQKLMRDLLDTMLGASGVGLAAPQIGIGRRVIVWTHEEELGKLADPEILEAAGSVEAEEGCLSLPGLYYPVLRAEWVRVKGLDETGTEMTFEASDFKARIIQHEIDHLDGVLFMDRLPPDLVKEAKRTLREQVMAGGTPPAPAVAL